MTDILRRLISRLFLVICRHLPASLLGVCCYHTALVDESGMNRTQMRTHTRSENGRSAWDALYDTAPQRIK
jgi:hypothetical protein